jgi:eukaryotic-like serine/threonine-protein kinase
VRDTVMDLLVAHLHEAPRPPRQLRPDLPADLEEVILTCLQKDPDHRYPDVEDLDRVLSRCESAGDWDADHAEMWWDNLRAYDGPPPPGPDPESGVPTLQAPAGSELAADQRR